MKAVATRKFKTICCICWRQKGKNGWQEMEIKSFTDLSHGYCPDCYRQTMLAYGLAPGPGRTPGTGRKRGSGLIHDGAELLTIIG